MIRRFPPVLAAILLAVALWPAAGSLRDLTGEEKAAGQLRGIIHWFNTAIRPQPRLDIETTPLYGAERPFGMNTFLQQEVLPEVREKTLEMLADARFIAIRQQFPWEDIEIHGKGDYIDRRNDPGGVDAWAKYDNIVELAERHGVEVIARLDNPPAWSRELGDDLGTRAPPDDFDDYGDFVAAVVARYRDRITYFQLWNEPNIYPEWGEQEVDPEAFTRLLCTGYRRAKEANPEAIILAGALSPTIALDGRDLNDLVFLQRMYRAGAGDCFDIFSAQGYGLWSGPTDRRLRPTVINFSHVLLLRDVMVRSGDASKPIWISEAGWNTVPEELPSPYGRVDSALQARYAVEAYERALTDWPFVGLVNYWFFKRPSDSERDQPWYYFRLLEPDFTPTLAWTELARFAGSFDPDQIEERSPSRERLDRFRPAGALAGASILFFWLLQALAPAATLHDRRSES